MSRSFASEREKRERTRSKPQTSDAATRHRACPGGLSQFHTWPRRSARFVFAQQSIALRSVFCPRSLMGPSAKYARHISQTFLRPAVVQSFLLQRRTCGTGTWGKHSNCVRLLCDRSNRRSLGTLSKVLLVRLVLSLFLSNWKFSEFQPQTFDLLSNHVTKGSAG